VESGVLAGLLLAVVASVMVGSHATLLGAVSGAWLVLGVIVGVRNVLDAGCYFMLLVVGVMVVVDLATNGAGSLLH
jgi:Flp pilus assembly pilin Flp